jgi:UDP-N-acetylmuramoyl-tripeptide--D-alanyl-D-alanine ligase
VKEMIWKILSEGRNVLKNEGTKNNHIGVPQTLLKLKDEHEFLVLELGSNHKGEIRRLADIARPTMAVITNIGPSHLEFLVDLDGVYQEKKDIFEFLHKRKGIAIINGDDDRLDKLSDKRFKFIRFGLKQSNDFRADRITIKKNKLTFILNGKASFRLNLLGMHNVHNALAAIAVASQFDMDHGTISDALLNYKPTYMRLNLKKVNGVDIIDDSYNSNPLSMQAALEALERYPAKAKWVVSADMLELGSKSSYFHRLIGQSIARSGVEGLITFGRLSKHTLSEARQFGMDKDSLWHCSSHDEIVRILKGIVKEGDVVLLKGSRSMKMEEVLKKLTT